VAGEITDNPNWRQRQVRKIAGKVQEKIGQVKKVLGVRKEYSHRRKDATKKKVIDFKGSKGIEPKTTAKKTAPKKQKELKSAAIMNVVYAALQ